MNHFKRVFIPYTYQADSFPYESNFEEKDLIFTVYESSDSKETEEADNKINELLANGWRIVAAVPCLGTTSEKSNNSNGETIIQMGVYTDGIEVLLVKD